MAAWSNDAVDRFNFKWMVLVLLLLSLVSFLIPLHPTFQNNHDQNEHNARLQTKGSLGAGDLPRVKVDCWCPPEFTTTFVKYSNTYCGNAFNAMIRGDNSSSIYDVLTDVQIPIESHSQRIDKSRREFFQRKREREAADVQGNRNLKDRVQKLVAFQTPMMLLVFGLCLALPQAVWSCLSDFLSSFNIGQTLQAAEQVNNLLDIGSRKDTFEELSAGISNSVRSSPKILGVLYLFKKTLNVLVVLVLLITLSQHTIPQVEDMENNINNSKVSISSHTSENIQNTTDDPFRTFVCDFKIRKLHHVQSWTVQCEISNVDEIMQETPQTDTLDAFERERSLLEFESTVFKIVVGLLVVLVVGNVASLVTWLSRLACDSCSASLGLAKDTAIDIRLLVYMARINTSAAVSEMLARGHRGGFDKIILSEMESQ